MIINGYVIKEQVFLDTHYTIYRGLSTPRQEDVLIKVCSSKTPNFKQLAGLRHEYQLLKDLHLPGIARVCDLIKTPPQLALIYNNVQGDNLQNYITNSPLSLDVFFDVALQLTSLLNELHAIHIIHKDINPKNIFINPENLEVNLMNFNISSQLNEDSSAEYLPITQLEGSLSHLSPEQTGRMNRPIDYRSDFYSLGVTFFELLTGKLPFKGKDSLEIVYHHMATVPPLAHEINPKIPAQLSAIIAKLLAKMPEERYSSSSGIQADLQRCKSQWKSSDRIDNFTLGSHDLMNKLNVSHKLYGRDEVIGHLMATFEQIAGGKNALIFITGYSGIGKSSLIQELRKPVLERKGFFLSGKFDQLQRDIPYSAFIQCFQELVKQLLSEPEETIVIMKQRLLNALGNNGQIIVNIVPSIEQLIGTQPQLVSLPSDQAENRFTFTLETFIAALAHQEHPLVLFLDDLQWIDPASLNLLRSLLTNNDVSNLLVLGAYRDSEVAEDHLLNTAFTSLNNERLTINKILLVPLKKRDVQLMLADSLNMSFNQLESLSDLVFNKTQGNPFFINVFLKMLYKKNLLKVNLVEAQWEWDLSAIQHQTITDNVVDLILSSIDELSEEVQYLLKIAACMGYTFDLQKLAIITGKSLEKMAQSLLVAINLNLVMPLNENYQFIESATEPNVLGEISFRFVHDKIQQTIYQMISEDELPYTHLQIGRILLQEELLKSNSKHFFTTLNHLNQGISLIDSPIEKKSLAESNLLAAKRAKMSIAYTAAIKYLNAAASLLKGFEDDNNLKYEINKNTAECFYLLRDLNTAEHYIQLSLSEEKNKLLRAELFLVKINAFISFGQHIEAIQLAKEALKELHFHLPEKVTTLQIIKEVARIEIRSLWRNKENPLFPADSSRILLINKILATISSPCYLIDHNLFAFVTCKLVNLAYTKGYTIDTSFSCLTYALILISSFNKLERGFYFVNLAKCLDELSPNPPNQSKINFLLGSFINHWKYSFDTGMRYLNKVQPIGIEEGDLAYAGYGQLINLLRYYLGKPLSELIIEIQYSLRFLTRTGDSGWLEYMKILEICLQGLVNDFFGMTDKLTSGFNKIEATGNRTALATAYNILSQIHYINNDYEKALVFSTAAQALKEYHLGSYDSIFALFFHGLILAGYCSEVNFTEKKSILKTLYGIQKKFKRWCTLNKANFLGMYHLLTAEIITITQDFSQKAMGLYNDAIHFFQSHNYIQFLAIANECAARFYLKCNQSKIAQIYFIDAYYAYSQWGALSKCKQLKARYPEFLQTTELIHSGSSLKTLNSPSNIDVLSIFKLSKTISSEIKLDVLLKKLLIILLQNAGAQRAVLMVKNNHWYVQAEGTSSEQKIHLNLNQLVSEREDLPYNLLLYAERTQDVVVLQSPEDFERLNIQELNVSGIKQKSLLIIPILYQGQLQNLIYLENKLTSYAFPFDRIQALTMIASQAAISLENAKLYHATTHDLLTGLANRSLLYQTFEYCAARATRDNRLIAIIFLDLDYFKVVNDKLGHEVGDKLLTHFADLIRKCLRKDSLAVRLGGDEFVIMLDGINDRSEVETLVERLYRNFKKPVKLLDSFQTVSSSMGVSFYPYDAKDIHILLKMADMALYRAKELGKNHCQFFRSDMINDQQELEKAAELKTALKEEQFTLHFQPIINIQNNQIQCLEALIRWEHPTKGCINAKEFISYAEKANLIIAIDNWVVDAVCKQIKTWQNQNLPLVPVAVNISGAHFKSQSVNELFKNTLNKYQLDASCIEIELTESIFIETKQKTLDDICELKAMGIKIILDDFGMGFSCLSYLKYIMPNKLKLDQLFVAGICDNAYDKKIIGGIIALAHHLSIEVIAEGVENGEQLYLLKENQVDSIQGYFISSPLKAQECRLLLENPLILNASKKLN